MSKRISRPPRTRTPASSPARGEPLEVRAEGEKVRVYLRDQPVELGASVMHVAVVGADAVVRIYRDHTAPFMAIGSGRETVMRRVVSVDRFVRVHGDT